MRRAGAAVVAVVATGCTVRNPALPDAGLRSRCESASECDNPAFPLCIEGRCGNCETSDACPTELPVCGDDRACRTCAVGSECASGVCDTVAGTCPAEADVVYVAASGGASGSCSRAAPCGTIQQGVDAAAGSRRWILIAAGHYGEAVSIADKAVELVGAGQDMTELVPPAGKSGITIARAGTVGIAGMKIRGATGSGADGVYCMAGSNVVTVVDSSIADNAGAGVDRCGLVLRRSTISGSGGAGIDSGTSMQIEESTLQANGAAGIHSQGGTVTVKRSTIRGNLGGGLDLGFDTFAIENSMIVKNGGPASSVGGVRIQAPSAAGTIRFSTIASNNGQGTGIGVTCAGVAMSAAPALDDNVVWNNTTDGTEAQVAGANCTWMRSLIGPQMVGQNVNTDPMFANPDGGDFHLQAASPARDAADPASAPVDDIDGDPRPDGAAPDLGADEVHP